jgi:hypothetical protein
VNEFVQTWGYTQKKSKKQAVLIYRKSDAGSHVISEGGTHIRNEKNPNKESS